jgi:hypothetical protein
MTLRDRCKELVRELTEPGKRVGLDEWLAGHARGSLDAGLALQAALDATEGEALDAARLDWLERAFLDDTMHNLLGPSLRAAIDHAMKESKP